MRKWKLWIWFIKKNTCTSQNFISTEKESKVPSFLSSIWSVSEFSMAKPVSTATSSIAQTLKRYLKKPWEITGPCADPEYKLAVPGALEYRLECPASTQVKACVPTSNPETVYDIKYYARDQRRNRPPIRRTVLKKADVEELMKEKKTFDVSDFPPVYLTDVVEEDCNARGGGYQKWIGFALLPPPPPLISFIVLRV